MDLPNEPAFNFLSNFLAQYSHKIENYSISKMQGDAGFRSYCRVSSKVTHEANKAENLQNACNYIFMDCPPSYASIKPFIDVANYINSTNIKAPKIYAYDEQKGYALLEDFGKISGRDFLESLAGSDDYDRKIESFYKIVIDILIELQNDFDSVIKSNSSPRLKNLPKLKHFSNELLIKELEVFLEWYINLIGKGGQKGYVSSSVNRDSNHEKISQEFLNTWSDLLSERPMLSESILLRDYHVENMMMLDTDNISVSSIGLLDFQDALIGSPVYDLVSLLEDARIDVSRDLALKMIRYFAQKKSMDVDEVMHEYHILGTQRNLRILGVFARKALRDKDDRYLAYIPRMIHYIGYDLSLPGSDNITKLKSWLRTYTDITF